MEEWRLLNIENPDLAAMNLAIDEAIFIEKTKRTVPPTLRFWKNKKAVVIGYSQNVDAEVNLDMCREEEVQIVRRFSGGGAVYQDFGNLNYSIAIEADHPFLKGMNIIETFRALSYGVVEGLKEFGIELIFDPPSDLLVKDKKISGNAQSRRKGIIFHHGTLLVNTDLDFLNRILCVPAEKIASGKVTSRKRLVTNLEDEIGCRIEIAKVKEMLLQGFEKVFSIKLIPNMLTPEEKRTADTLYAEKYSKKEWNFWR